MSEFKMLYDSKAEIISNYLSSLFPDVNIIPDPLYGAMKSTMSGGGKRIRPVLMLAASEIFEPNLQEVLPLAAAIELIHNYSLVHDDLPCMDDDELRRNKPTCHMIYGEGMAVLTGDALLNMAYEQVMEGIVHSKDIKRYTKAATILARNAGAKGMIAGQCYDMKYENSDAVTETELLLIHKNKTSKLIEAAVLCGAIISGASEAEEMALLGYAEKIGLVFQITDDILDIVGDSLVLGKPVGSDVESDKLTFPKIYGIEKSKKLCVQYIDEAIAFLDIFGEKAEFLKMIAQNMLERVK